MFEDLSISAVYRQFFIKTFPELSYKALDDRVNEFSRVLSYNNLSHEAKSLGAIQHLLCKYVEQKLVQSKSANINMNGKHSDSTNSDIAKEVVKQEKNDFVDYLKSNDGVRAKVNHKFNSHGSYNNSSKKFDASIKSLFSKNHKPESCFNKSVSVYAVNGEMAIQDAALKQINALRAMVAAIRAGYPDQASLFDDIGRVLDDLLMFHPLLTAEQLVLLSSLPKEMGRLMEESTLSKDFCVMLWRNSSQEYKDAVSEFEEKIQILEDDIANLEVKVSESGLARSIILRILGLFSNVNLPGFSPNAIGEADLVLIVASLMWLVDNYDNLTSDMRSSIQMAMTSVIANRSADVSVCNYISHVWFYIIAGKMIAEHPLITISDLLNLISDYVADYAGSTFPYMYDIVNYVNQIIAINGDALFNGWDLIFDDGGIAALTKKFLALVTDDPGIINKFTDQDLVAVAAAYEFFSDNTRVLINSLNADKAVLLRTLSRMQSYVSQVVADSYYVESQVLVRLPIAEAVASVLLDHFMPKELKYLSVLTDFLYYNNVGSNAGNSIAEEMIGFVDASSYFYFGSFIGNVPSAGVDGFPGDIDHAKQVLQDEISNISVFLKKTSSTIAMILAQVDLIQNDERISEKNKLTLVDMFMTYKLGLDVITATLIALEGQLKCLNIEPVSSEGKVVPGVFNVTGFATPGWLNTIRELETALYSGVPGAGYYTGMNSLNAKVQSDQQAFSDSGQSQQLELQMHLTAMQQEWTVIATSLQILNQIYLGLARSILR